MLPQLQDFLKMIINQEYPFIGNPGMKLAVENQADVMSYFDHYVPPELIEIVVDQTNL